MGVSKGCELRSDAQQEHDGGNGIGMRERQRQGQHRRESVPSEMRGKEDIKSKLIIITLFIKEKNCYNVNLLPEKLQRKENRSV